MADETIDMAESNVGGQHSGCTKPWRCNAVACSKMMDSAHWEVPSEGSRPPGRHSTGGNDEKNRHISATKTKTNSLLLLE